MKLASLLHCQLPFGLCEVKVTSLGYNVPKSSMEVNDIIEKLQWGGETAENLSVKC